MVNFKVFQPCTTPTPLAYSLCIVFVLHSLRFLALPYPPLSWHFPFVNEIIFLPPSLPKPKASLSITHFPMMAIERESESRDRQNGAKGQWQRRKEACVRGCVLSALIVNVCLLVCMFVEGQTDAGKSLDSAPISAYIRHVGG